MSSLSNILETKSPEVCCISETHANSKELLRHHKNYKAYHKFRKEDQIAKGGIVTLVKKELVNDTIMLDQSTDDLEWQSIKINHYSPPLVIVLWYAVPESQSKVAKVKQSWDFMLKKIVEYETKGWNVILNGDLNAGTGQEFIPNNHPSLTNGGKKLNSFVKKNPSWTILNSLDKVNGVTHYDRSSSTNRTLDYVITNSKGWSCNIDVNKDLTPYRVTCEVPGLQRKYSDHLTIISETRLKLKSILPKKRRTKFIITEDGQFHFTCETRRIAEELDEKIDTLTNNQAIQLVNRRIKQAKYKCYKVITVKTSETEDVIDDCDMVLKHYNEINEELESVDELKINDKIWEIRKRINRKQEDMFAMLNEDGQLVTTESEIKKVQTIYNQTLLSRKPHPEEFKEIHDFKKEALDLLEATSLTMEPPTMVQYIDVLNKVYAKNKNMFREFMSTDISFKNLIFKILCRIFETGEIPDSFLTTQLVPLHKKGPKTDPAMYRYLHIKDPYSRLYDSLLHQKLAQFYNFNTPISQLGGQPRSGCEDHLTHLLMMIKDAEDSGGGMILTTVDVKKCFDMISNIDTAYAMLEGGADQPTLKRLYQLNKTTNINVVGSTESFCITHGKGQGNCNVCQECAYTMSVVSEKNCIEFKTPIIYKGVNSSVFEFVDDTFHISRTLAEARMSGKVVTNTFDELSLEAHPYKSKQIIVGTSEYCRKMKAAIQKDPVQIQGNDIGTSDEEKYLGLVICSGSYKKTLKANLDAKMSKAIGVAKQIRAIMEDKRMEQIGKLKVAALLVQGQLLPTILYGLKSFLNLHIDNYYEKFEAIYKKSLEIILGVPESTCLEAMINLLDNHHLETWIDVLKIKYMNTKFNYHRKLTKRRSRLQALWEFEMLNGVKGGLVDELTRLCEKYKLPNLNHGGVEDDYINAQVKSKSKLRIYMKLLQLKKYPMVRPGRRSECRAAWELDPYLQQCIKSYYLGLLITRTSNYHQLRPNLRGDKTCLFDPCVGRDDIAHMMECEFYTTRYDKDGDDQEVVRFARYLSELNLERIKRFKQPMIYLPMKSFTSSSFTDNNV